MGLINIYQPSVHLEGEYQSNMHQHRVEQSEQSEQAVKGASEVEDQRTKPETIVA